MKNGKLLIKFTSLQASLYARASTKFHKLAQYFIEAETLQRYEFCRSKFVIKSTQLISVNAQRLI